MRSETAAQTAASLFLAVLMAVALILVDQGGLPFGMVRPPAAGGTDSYDLLHLPFNLADRLTGEVPAPPREEAPAAQTTSSPAITPAAATQDSVSVGDAVGRAASRLPAVDRPTARTPQPDRAAPGRNGRGTPAPADTPRHGNGAQPIEPTGQNGRGQSGSNSNGRGRADAPGRDQAPTRTADKPRQPTVSQRDGAITAAVHRSPQATSAGKGGHDSVHGRDRKPAQRRTGSARPRHAARRDR